MPPPTASDLSGRSSAEEEDMVLLSSLRQIGDVILVHDESAVQPPFDSEGFLRLVGFEVVTGEEPRGGC